MSLRMFLATVAAALIIAFAISWMMPLHAFASECTQLRASWYGAESGNRTANGEHFDGTSLTAASRTLPFGTRLRVTYHGKSVVVRVNDYGPAAWTHRDLDLSEAAARKIGIISVGVARVCAQLLS